MRSIVVIAHNIRSSHNIGSLLRTAEGLGLETVYITGYSPYPNGGMNDTRLPHEARKAHDKIAKTALGAEATMQWEHRPDVEDVLAALKDKGYTCCALEQTDSAVPLHTFDPPKKVALILGTETTGIESRLLGIADAHLVIPMYGSKESFNVVQAAAMALFHLRFAN